MYPLHPKGNADMNAAISISNLKKTYPRRWASPPFEALKGISLCIEAGETFGFVGPNGAGKSTAIKILTGVMSPSAGTASTRCRGCNAAQALEPPAASTRSARFS